MTPDEIAQCYAAMGESVSLINGLIGEPAPYLDTADTLQRNVDHLTAMRAKDYWTAEDMTAVDAAITAGAARISQIAADGVERPQYETIQSAKAAMRGWINHLTAQITEQYPTAEVASWPTKNDAARAVIVGNARADHQKMIADEAALSGRTVQAQAERVIAKADAYQAIVSAVAGFRASVDAQLEAAQTPDQYKAILDAAQVQAKAMAAAMGLT
jgi:hypothetical protein